MPSDQVPRAAPPPLPARRTLPTLPDPPDSPPPDAQRRPSRAEIPNVDTWPAGAEERPTNARLRSIEERVGEVEYPPRRPRQSVGPVSSGASVEVGGVGVKVSKKAWERIRPWLLWVIGPLLTSLGAGVWGYFEGLARAGARVSALEQRVAVQRSDLTAERAYEDERLRSLAEAHDIRFGQIERAEALLSERTKRLEEKLPSVKP